MFEKKENDTRLTGEEKLQRGGRKGVAGEEGRSPPEKGGGGGLVTSGEVLGLLMGKGKGQYKREGESFFFG